MLLQMASRSQRVERCVTVRKFILTLYIPSSCRKQSTLCQPFLSLRPIVFLRSHSTPHFRISSFNHMTVLWKFFVCEPMKKYAKSTLAGKNGLTQKRPWVRQGTRARWPIMGMSRRPSWLICLCHTLLYAPLARLDLLHSPKKRVRKMLFRYVATFRQFELCPMFASTALLRVIE